MVRCIESEVTSDKMAIEGVDALGGDEPKWLRKDTIIGTGAP